MKIAYLPEGRIAQLRTVERAIRDELYHLPERDSLTTTELVLRIAGAGHADQKTRQAVYRLVDVIAKHCPSLYRTEPGEGKAFMTGKTVNVKHWHHIDSPDMPPEPPAGTPSTGAASSIRRIDPALDALARRVERIERFLVLDHPIGDVEKEE